MAGKFAAGWCFFLFLWLPTVLYPVLLSRFGTLDWGPIASGYLGIALVGALFISAGTFASALTKNQIVAAIVGFVFILGVFIVGVFRDFVTDPAFRDALVVPEPPRAHGRLRPRASSTRGASSTWPRRSFFFLFLSTRALEANKGR